MNKAERAHLDKVARIGCIVCIRLGYGESPAEIHHPRKGAGMGQRASHYDAIPLCPSHHRTGGYGVAIHAGQKEFERLYGTEAALLDEVRRLCGFDS